MSRFSKPCADYACTAEQVFRRMVLIVIATNYDDHTKNILFRLKQGGNWELAPAYDVCYAFDPSNIWVSRQTLSINGKQKDISRADLMTIAKANNIKKREHPFSQKPKQPPLQADGISIRSAIQLFSHPKVTVVWRKQLH